MSAPRIAAVIGSPVSHSLSPAIHQAAFDAAGVNWAYTAFDITDAAAALSAMRLLGLAGLSVTMPLKEDAARAVDRLDPAARVLHSVNTVSWDGDQLVGSSTDGAGFVASLAAAGVEVDGAQISVIGAGGAARSVIDALGRAGAADITVLNRTPERAEQAASLSRAASVGIGSDVTRADIVVNATSIGMGVSIDDAMDADMACDPALL
ncbi:MAG: shikimate dehydrogenase, partial [Ilumatobacter sp.]